MNKVDPEESAVCALAYAMWDSSNTCRMPAGQIDHYVDWARSVRYWLKVHGHDVTKLGEFDPLL